MLHGTLLFGGISWLFYDSWIPFAGIPVFLVFYLRIWENGCCRKKEEAFCIQFQDSLRSLAASLRAGYSAENAIRETARDLELIYTKEVRILKEFRYMIRQLDMNVPLEQALRNFASRTPQEDVESFVSVFVTAGKAGGDGIAVIQNTVKVLYDKLEVRREIQTLISAKQLEFKVMSVIPFGIIFYMRLSFQEFMSALYGDLPGAGIMSICLGVYLAAWNLGRRIVEIEV